MDNFIMVDGYRLKKKVRAIVVNESSQYLLIRPHGYDEDSWTFIGGGVEEGESESEALYRELYEEANISTISRVKKSQLVNWYVFSDKFKAKNSVDYDGQHASYFHVVVPDEVNISIQQCEVSDFCWCDKNEVLERIKVPVHAKIFQELAGEFNFSSF
jgi:8-oxo-dGTP pyrophosphatase MutT (NUDIX family)